MKNIVEKIKGITNKHEGRKLEELSSIVNSMKRDANTHDNTFLYKYAQIIEQQLELNSRELVEVDEIVNLTSHKINILDEDGDVIISVDPSGKVARVDQDDELVQIVRYKTTELEVVRYKSTGVDNLPEPEPGKIFIVSRMVAAKSNRTDLYVPDNIKHDKYGDKKGCTRLCKA